MPSSLLIKADSSKSILWLGFSNTCLLKAESKEMEAILEFTALVISSLCCCRRFSKFLVGSTYIEFTAIAWYLIDSSLASNWSLIFTRI